MSDSKPTPQQSVPTQSIKGCGNTGRAWPAAANQSGGKTGNPSSAGGGTSRPDKAFPTKS